MIGTICIGESEQSLLLPVAERTGDIGVRQIESVRDRFQRKLMVADREPAQQIKVYLNKLPVGIREIIIKKCFRNPDVIVRAFRYEFYIAGHSPPLFSSVLVRFKL